MDPKTDWRVWQDPQVATRFAQGRRAGLPGVAQQFETLSRLLRRVSRRPLRVLDLGCGDGAVIAAVRETDPQSRVVGVDGSMPMLERARLRFADSPDSTAFVQADFNHPGWPELLPEREFDAVVSGFAIHHSEDDAKQRIYAQAYALLAPGGVFVNIEHVASASPAGEAMWREILSEHVAAHVSREGTPKSPAEVLEEINRSGEQDANRLSPLQTQLQWLRELGFADVDCYWKWFELAVIAGFRR